MRWWFCLPLLSAIGIAACGGGSSATPTQSPAVSDARCGIPMFTVSRGTKAIALHNNISLKGRVMALEAPTPTRNGLIRGFLLRVQDSLVDSGDAAHQLVEPDSEVYVQTAGDSWPEFKVGACANVSGDIGGFSCTPPEGGIGDCSGFFASKVEQYDLPDREP